jgi:hypothetical protein
MQAPSVSSFVSALSALHEHPDPAVKSAANVWLMRFQESSSAWQVCDALLHTPGQAEDVYYNAANILRQKLLHSYNELPGQQQQRH